MRDQIVLTKEQAYAICAVLIEMACRLPLKHRNHGFALDLLGWQSHEQTRSLYEAEQAGLRGANE